MAVMALELLAAGDPAAAAELLRRAQIEHAGDLWINVHFADACERLDTPDRDTALRMHSASVALRPESLWMRERPGRIQLACEDVEGAAGTWRILGEMLLEEGLVDRAVSTLETSERAYAKIETEEPRNWCLLAKCRARQDDADAARTLLDRVKAWKEGKDLINEEVLRLEREARALLAGE